MAQTKRKRRSKHRGTPAGTIEARGRTGRKPTAEELKRQQRDANRNTRMLRAPSWNGAALRAGVAALLLLIFTQLGIGPDMPLGQSFAVAAFAMLIYIPLGYYTDRFLYRRRMARDAAAAQRQREQQQGR